jgi:hypothetical protein
VNSLSFKVKANVNASDAVLRIKNGTTRSDCRSASSCAVLIAHLNVLQAAWVDGQIAAGALQIGEAFYFLAGPNTDTNTVIIGDHRYMQNDTRYYNAALANGLTQQTAIWNGEHAICVATGGVVGTQYTGLGLPSQTEDQLRSRLKQALLDDARISLTDAQAKANIVWTALDRPTIFP